MAKFDKTTGPAFGKLGGRPRGIRRQKSGDLKESVLRAFKERGGVDYLKELSETEFNKLLLKCMPSESHSDITVTTLEQLVAGATKPSRAKNRLPDVAGSITEASGN